MNFFYPKTLFAIASGVMTGVIVTLSPLNVNQASASTLHNLSINATADNSYGIYFGTDTAVHQFIGGAQNRTAGEIASVESFSPAIASTDEVYVVAWSDRGVIQGLLIDIFNDTTGEEFLSGDLDWEVAATGVSLPSVTSPFPTLDELTAQIELANEGNNPSEGWKPVTVTSLTNGDGPMVSGFIDGFADISPDSRMMWYDNGRSTGSEAPFKPGADHDEYLIFRMSTGGSGLEPVPESSLGIMTFLGAAALAGWLTVRSR